MSTVYTNDSRTAISPAEYRFVLHSDPDLGYRLRSATTTDVDTRDLLEQRLESAARAASKFIYWLYGKDLDEMHHDEAVQAGMIRVWQMYQNEPDMMRDKPEAFWNAVAVNGARRAAYGWKLWYYRGETQDGKRNRFVPFVQLMTDLEREDSKDDLLSRLFGSATCIDEVDNRLDLAMTIRAVLKRLPEAQRDDVWRMMEGAANGMTHDEIRKANAWTEGRIRRTARLMQDTFCEVVTGEKAQPGRTKPKATTSEVERVRELHAEGWSMAQIAATIGRSKAFVQQILNPTKAVASPEVIEEVKRLRDEGVPQREVARRIGKSRGYVQTLYASM